MVTQAQVAAAAGVAQKTVSNVISGHPHVRPEVRERVLQAIESLGYRPNNAARSLRTGRSAVIGLALPELDLGYFAELARLVVEVAEEKGYTVLIAQTLGDRQREMAVLKRFDDQMAEGAIFSPIACTAQDLASRPGTTPVVLLGEHLFAGHEDHVGIDNTAAAQAATTHLIELGRSNIAFIGTAKHGTSEMADLRQQGYRKALRQAGIRWRPRLSRPVDGYHRSHGMAAADALLDDVGDTAIDGLFCANDLLAQGAMRALHVRGLRVPDDVAVVGFDDIDESSYGPVTLTSVRPNKLQIAHSAVARLLDRIGGHDTVAREQTIEFTLALRESTIGDSRR